jgi:mandelamide amidase
MAPLGLAEDTEGSIRVPAAMCGLSGFRPTTGRYPTQGCAPISPLFDQVGPLARSVADLMLFDSVAAREPAQLPPRSTKRPSTSLPLQGVRLGLIDYGYAGLDEKLEHVIDQALQRLRQAGAQLIRGEMPGLQALIDKTTDPVQNHDVRIHLAKYLKDYQAGVSFDEVVARASPDIQALFKTDVLPGGVNFVTEEMYAAARDIHLPALRRLYRDYFARSGVSAIVFPATLTPPPRIGEEDTLLIRGAKVPFATAVSRNIAPGSTAGLPGLVLPAGLTSDGLPVGIEFDGPAGTDLELLEIGLGLEQALGPLPAPR